MGQNSGNKCGGWVDTMCNVGGRVRASPPKLWSSFGHGLETPATGAADSKRFAHSAGPLTPRVQAQPVGSFLCAKTVSKWCPKRAKMEPASKVMHSKLQNGNKSRQGVVFVKLPRPF